MAQLPADRSKLALAQGNQVPGSVASATKNINAMTEAYDTIDTLYGYVNQTLQGIFDADKFSQLGIINVKDKPFNAKGDGVTNDTAAIQAAINAASTSGGIVVIPKGTYKIGNSQSITIPSNVCIRGNGMNSSIVQSDGGSRTAKAVIITGSNVIIESIGFDLKQVDLLSTTLPQTQTIIEISGSYSNIMFNKCNFKNAFAGVWMNPSSGSVMSNITIEDCDFSNLNFPIHLGIMVDDRSTRTDRIYNVTISRNHIHDGYYASEGVKTAQRCDNIMIVNNIIENMKRDAIDLFASGNDVIVSNNILRGNLEHGIDIKRNTTDYPQQFYGYVQKILILGNLIEDNQQRGVSINQLSNSVDDNHTIIVSNNVFAGNYQDAINVSGNYINVENNMFFRNCSATSGDYSAIRVLGMPAKRIKGLNISNNQVMNNGSSTKTTTGINILAFVDDSNVTGNVIINDTAIENPNQKVGLYVNGDCTNITVRQNKIKGHTRNAWIKNGADVHGESLYIPIGDIAKSDFNKNFLGISVKSQISLVDARFLNAANIDVPGADTGYLVFQLCKVVSGVVSAALASSNTTSTGITAYVPRVVNIFTNNSDLNTDTNLLNVGDVILFNLIGASTGKPLTNANVEIRYIKY